jgi:hypothetical protein
MKRLLLAAVAALALVPGAFAQTTNAPPGMSAGGAINPGYFAANTDAQGFNTDSLTPALVVPATSTAQAAWTNGQVTSGTVITTKATVITTCSGTTGPTLPSVQRYEPITIMNRSGGSCLIFPSIGATVETALGTDGAANAAFTMLTNTDVTFRPITATRWLQ